VSLGRVVFPDRTGSRIAVASRDEGLVRRLERDCRRLGFQVRPAVDPARLVDSLAGAAADVVLLDAHLLGPPGAAPTGPSLLDRLLGLAEAPAVLLIAPAHDPSRAFDWLEVGASDVLNRPPHFGELRLRIHRVLEQRDVDAQLAGLEDEISERTRRAFAERELVARSAPMRELSSTIDRVARMRTTALVLGESGVGKELVARALHFRSPRSEGPFIAINCAALPPHLIESEIFGHEKGAFTGAISRRAGKFELAHRGTLFLDEVGETDLTTQVKLLRVLEQQEFMRVGGTRPVRVDVRLVAATNADLERMVREGRFREDLYYRLKVVTLGVPALRERREDIPDLVESFLHRVCRENNLRPRRLTPEAAEALARYSWPGNVRELMNTIEAVVVRTVGEVIEVRDLPTAMRENVQEPGPGASPASPLAGRALQDVETEAIRATLALAGGSRTRTAALLGIGLRTLRRRIHELGLDEALPPRPGRPRRTSSSASATPATPATAATATTTTELTTPRR
jgi:DNA-binding NtrC family response regulator